MVSEIGIPTMTQQQCTTRRLLVYAQTLLEPRAVDEQQPFFFYSVCMITVTFQICAPKNSITEASNNFLCSLKSLYWALFVITLILNCNPASGYVIFSPKVTINTAIRIVVCGSEVMIISLTVLNHFPFLSNKIKIKD